MAWLCIGVGFGSPLDSVLVLHGLDLEIADAANKSGFNTRNQVALMDLIWSVRRIAFRHAVERPRIERPPKHPVYPDRYRPGDPSDNTQRPRKRAREWEERRSCAGAGTVNSPIDLDGDGLEANGGGTVANSAAKRLKVAGGKIGRHTFQLPERPKIRNPVHPSKFSTSTSNRAEHGSTGAAGTTSMRSSGSLKHPRPRPLSASPIFHNRRALTATAQDMTVVELRKVGNTLKDNIDAVVKCGHVMRGLYDRDDRLGDGVIYKELERLKEVFDNSLRDAGAGIKYVHRVMSLLEDDRDRVIKLVDGKL